MNAMMTVREILRHEKSAIRVAALSGIPEAPVLNRKILGFKAKAVSVAAALRDGAATYGLVKSFLQEEIPAIPSEGPVSEVTAEVLKAASAFALLKAMAGLMADDPMAGMKGLREYLDLRRQAGEVGLESAIIAPPANRAPLDPELEDLSISLHQMVVVEAIEDPKEQWRVFRRFQYEDIRNGLVTKKDDPDWNYR